MNATESYDAVGEYEREWTQVGLDVAVCMGCAVGLRACARVGAALRRHGGALHVNVRVLLVNLLLCTASTCLAYLLATANDVVKAARSYYADERMTVVYSPAECRFLGLLKVTGIVGNMFAMFFLAIERMYATRKFKTYEDIKMPLFAVALCFIQWSVTLVALLVSSKQLYENMDESDIVTTCLVETFRNARSQLLPKAIWPRHLTSLLTEGGTTALFVLVWRQNIMLQSHDVSFASLTRRFQIKENIQSSLTLAGLVFFRTIWDVFSQGWYALTLVGVIYTDMASLRTFVHLNTGILMWNVVGGIVQSLLIINVNRKMAQSFPCFSRLTTTRQSKRVVSELENARTVQDMHFQNLDAEWMKQQKHKRQKKKPELSSVLVLKETAQKITEDMISKAGDVGLELDIVSLTSAYSLQGAASNQIA